MEMDNETSYPVVLPECRSMTVWALLFEEIKTYIDVSYYINVFVAPLMAVFGCGGYVLLFAHLRKQKRAPDSRFLAHIKSLCFWDCSILLIGNVGNLPSFVAHGRMVYFGKYLAWHLFLVQPFARATLTGSTWQTVTLAIERFLVVWRPLRMITRTDRVPVGLIFVFILCAGTAVNFAQHFIEFRLTPCAEPIDENVTIEISRQFQFEYHTVLNIVLLLLPFLVVHCPVPFLLILFSTVGTVYQVYMGRNSRSNQGARRLTIIFGLYNIKYLIFNSLMVFKTMSDVICGVYNCASGSPSALVPELFYQQWLNSLLVNLYSKEISTLMLIIHSATNWILFVSYKEVVIRGSTKNEPDSKLADSQVLTFNEARLMAQLWRHRASNEFGRQMLIALCSLKPELGEQLYGCANQNDLYFSKAVAHNGERITQQLDVIICDELCAPRVNMRRVRQMLRYVGAVHAKINLRLTTSDWQFLMQFMIQYLSESNDPEEKRVIHMVAALVVHELKTGYMCEQFSSGAMQPVQAKHSALTSAVSLTPSTANGGQSHRSLSAIGGGYKHQEEQPSRRATLVARMKSVRGSRDGGILLL